MRAAPSIEVLVSRFGVWRGFLAVLGVVSVVVPWSGLMSRSITGSWLAWLATIAAGVMSSAAVVSVWTATRPVVLRWDGERWGLAFAADTRKAHRSPVKPASGPIDGGLPSDRFQQGDLHVVIDFGGWLLLTFDSPFFQTNLETANASTDVNLQNMSPASRIARRRVWVALQRTGLERQWHGLRCALYSRASSTSLESSRPLNPRQSA